MTISDVNFRRKHLSVRTEGLDKAALLVNPLATKLQIDQAMQAGAETILNVMRSVTPSVTGRTRKAWRVQRGGSQGGYTVVNNTTAAVVLYTGAKPHLIAARNKRALSNRNVNSRNIERYGEFGPVKGVMHPGSPGNDSFVEAIDSKAGEAAYEVVAEMIQGFYINSGTVQRRSLTGRFGQKF